MSISIKTLETGGSFRTVEADKRRVFIEFSDEHIANGVFGSIKGEFPILDAPPNRWQFGYVTRGALGTVGFEWRLDDAGPPSTPYWRLITTARVGPFGYIFPRYRQIDYVVSNKGDIEMQLSQPGGSKGQNIAWIPHWLWPWVEAANGTNPNSEFGWFGLLPDDQWLPGPPPNVRPNVVPLTVSVFMRGEVMRAPGTGPGMAQMNYAAEPGSPQNFETQIEIKGYAGEQPPGHLHAIDNKEVPARSASGWIYVSANDQFIYNSLFCGFRFKPISSHSPQ